MGRPPRSIPGEVLNKGAWTASEDKILKDYVRIHGEGRWSRLSRETALKRCGKSCRLRWLNYLRPDIKRGNISDDEEELIIRLHNLLGNRWSLIAGRIPGRTDNEIKNYWNTNIVKKNPELLLPRPVTSCKIPRNSEAKPEQTNNVDTVALPQTNEINPSHEPKLEVNAGVSTGDDDMREKRMMLSDCGYLSDGSLSIMSTPEGNPNDFVIDFTVEDIYKILDADVAGRGEDVTLGRPDHSNIDCFVDDMGEAKDVSGFHLLESFFGPDDGVGVGVGVGGHEDVQPGSIGSKT